MLYYKYVTNNDQRVHCRAVRVILNHLIDILKQTMFTALTSSTGLINKCQAAKITQELFLRDIIASMIPNRQNYRSNDNNVVDSKLEFKFSLTY